MSKRSVIGLSITIFLIVLTSILFGVVFCLRQQTIKVIGETPIAIAREEIIDAGGLKSGESIFTLDKEKAINNIESKFSHIKVVQIKTVGLTKIEICVRARHEMFYIKANDKYYILDEELKVLDILEHSASEPTHLSKIETGELNIDETTMKCDFVGTQQQRLATYNLFVAMYSVVTKGDGVEETYLNREDIRQAISCIKFENFSSYNKILVNTKYGVVLDIENPQHDMKNKINICFSTIKQFISEGNNKEKSGTIKIYYNSNNELTSVYITQSSD